MDNGFSYDGETVTNSGNDQADDMVWKDADDLPERDEEKHYTPPPASTADMPYQIGHVLGSRLISSWQRAGTQWLT